MHRFLTSHNGGTFEMFMGARYLEFNDNFNVHTAVSPNALTQPNATGGGGTTVNSNVPSFLGGSYWDTAAENHIIGPQIGLHGSRNRAAGPSPREGRFMAGLNCQNISQQVDFGPSLNPGPRTVVTVINPNPPVRLAYNYVYQPFQPVTLSHVTATYVDYEREWSPAFELRVEAKYQITRAIEFKAGWTGFWMDGIARANSVVDYKTSTVNGEEPLGIDMSGNRQSLFVNGLNIGFTVNR